MHYMLTMLEDMKRNYSVFPRSPTKEFWMTFQYWCNNFQCLKVTTSSGKKCMIRTKGTFFWTNRLLTFRPTCDHCPANGKSLVFLEFFRSKLFAGISIEAS